MFNSYVKLPEGTSDVWIWLDPTSGLSKPGQNIPLRGLSESRSDLRALLGFSRCFLGMIGWCWTNEALLPCVQSFIGILVETYRNMVIWLAIRGGSKLIYSNQPELIRIIIPKLWVKFKAQKTLSHLSFRASHSDTHKAGVIGLVKCHRGFAKVSLHPILYWRMEIHGKNM